MSMKKFNYFFACFSVVSLFTYSYTHAAPTSKPGVFMPPEKSEQKYPFVHMALAATKDLKKIQRVIELWPEDLFKSDYRGKTALHFAVFFENSKIIIDYLLTIYTTNETIPLESRLALLTQKNHAGMTAAMLAKTNGFPEIENAIQIATAKIQNVDLLAWHKQQTQKPSQKHTASPFTPKRKSKTKRMLGQNDTQANKEQQDQNQVFIPLAQSPLLIHAAVVTGDLKLIKRVVDQNRLILYEQDADGNLALHLAARHGYRDVVIYLLGEYQKTQLLIPCITHTNNAEKTAADLAQEYGYHEIYKHIKAVEKKLRKK